MNTQASRSSRLTDAAIDAISVGRAEQLLAAYLRNALHTILPSTIAYWAEVLAAALAARAVEFAEDPFAANKYHG